MIALLYQRSSIGIGYRSLATLGPQPSYGRAGALTGEERIDVTQTLATPNQQPRQSACRIPRIWFSSCARPEGLLSRLVTEHSRFPRRLPAPGTAVMSSTTSLRFTCTPRRFSDSGPR